MAASYVEVYSQNSLFQDSQGKSAIKLFQNNIQLNSGDQSIVFSIDNISRKSSVILSRTLLNVKFNSNEGVTNLIKNEELLLDGSIGLYKEFKFAEGGISDKLYFSSDITFSRDKVFDLKRTEDIIYTDINKGWQLQFGTSAYRNLFRYGISVDLINTNNSSILSQSTVNEVVANSDNTEINVVNTIKAFDSDSYLANAVGFGYNMDLVFDLRGIRKRINPKLDINDLKATYVALLLRLQKVEGDDGSFNPAIGYYIAKDGNPSGITFGINWQFFNFGSPDNSDYIKNSVFSITAGYPF